MALSHSRMANRLFTMFAYHRDMATNWSDAVRRLAAFAALLLIAAVFAGNPAKAQDAQINWENAGLPSLSPFPNGGSVTAADGTSATVSRTVVTQGTSTFVPAFGGDFVSYFDGTIGSGVSPLLLSFDNSAYDPADKVTVTITFSRAVSNLRFSLSDIDNGNFADAVEVYFDNDLAGTVTNAATNTALWQSGTAVTRTNNATVNGWRGTANSANTSTNGDLAFNFGSQQVQRIQIVYFSYTGTGDPGTQFLALSDLRFAEAVADLSLTKQLVGIVPPNGGDVTWRLTIANAGSSSATASGIVVRDTFPSQFVFGSATGTGTFNPANGQWSVGTLTPGSSASIDITGVINAPAGTVITNIAEIIASSARDPNSTPGNGVTTENDYAAATFTVRDFSSTPPALSCPVGQTVFDWDNPAIIWAGGSTANSYPLASFGTIGFNITGDGIFAARASFGGAVPALTTAVGGGLSPAERALGYNANNTNRQQQFVTTITLPRDFEGVQFTIFDIDAVNGFQDRVTAYGLRNGTRVEAILTASAQNSISGDTILGTGGAADDLGIANGTITFLQPVDTIIFEYGNGPLAFADPTNQSIALHDITLCNPLVPAINVTKVSTILSDPANGTTNPKAIPGALVEYLISISNTGSGATDADSVEVIDNGPADAKLCQIERVGGPVVFTDPGGSGLTYSYVAPGSTSDNLEFSADGGATWTYVPSADAQGCDAAVTSFRLRPGGAMAAGSSVNLRARYIIE